MSQQTKIEWTKHTGFQGVTWNPVRGCSRVSPGCGKGSQGGCYAERMAARGLPGLSSPTTGEPFAVMTAAGPRWTGRVELIESKLTEPLHWRKPRCVFVNSMSDLFHEKALDWLVPILNVMQRTPQHRYLVLTKRSELMCKAMTPIAHGMGILPNLWLGVSAEDQGYADKRIPHLLRTPAAVRFVSLEPMLGPVDISRHLQPHWTPQAGADSPPWLDWVIVGGESGPGARPMHPDWARSVRDQCQAAGVPFFWKQWGEWGPYETHDGSVIRSACVSVSDGSYAVRETRLPNHGEMIRVGKKAAGRLLDGREWNEIPEVRR